MMTWYKLLTPLDQSGEVNPEPSRSRFERDYDELIYSSSFRRLQMKTQVYPLSGLTMVHNRLTHTLEVASVGRSLTRKLYDFLKEREKDFCEDYRLRKVYKDSKLNQSCSDNLQTDLAAIVTSACLAHDLGNPPFGHFGEKAIRYFFDTNIFGNGQDFSPNDPLNKLQIEDFLSFDGNANGFRLLTNCIKGKREHGMGVSFPTLAAIVKYPWDSTTAKAMGKEGKFGYFQYEKELFEKVTQSLGLLPKTFSANQTLYTIYPRHPLVFIMEAADDICNFFIDLQDAEHIGLVTCNKVFELIEPMLLEEEFITKQESTKLKTIFCSLKESDSREALIKLRTPVYQILIDYCWKNFENHYSQIMEGSHNNPLIEGNKPNIQEVLKKVGDYKKENLFSARKVIQLELSGLGVISNLLKTFYYAIVAESPNFSDKHLIKLLPFQFREPKNRYETMLAITDFISGMTDEYALDLHRKITGQKIPELD